MLQGFANMSPFLDQTIKKSPSAAEKKMMITHLFFFVMFEGGHNRGTSYTQTIHMYGIFTSMKTIENSAHHVGQQKPYMNDMA